MTKSKAKTINSDNTAKTTKLAVTAMLAALSAVLMFFEFPLGFIAPSFYEAGFIYKYKKTRVGAIVGMLTGTVAMAAIGVVLNTFVLVPLYSSFMPLTEIIKMGQAIFPAIDGTFTFCLYCVGPFNIIKGLIISVVVFIIYKPLSRLINSLDALLTKKKKATVQ